MNVSPRKVIVALVAGSALLVGTTAGSCSSPRDNSRPVDTGGNSVNNPDKPDCDLGDMLEGDSDCDNESEADNKSRKAKEKAAKARQKAADKARKSQSKSGLFGGKPAARPATDISRPRINIPRTQTKPFGTRSKKR